LNREAGTVPSSDLTKNGQQDDTTEPITCGAPQDGHACDVLDRFEVVITLTSGAVADRHGACFRHGLAEVERATAAGSIARVELIDKKPAPRAAASVTFGVDPCGTRGPAVTA
jgi:hypothetical protein